jgi:hypothetical protein
MTIAYTGPTSITISLASLPTSSDFTAGAESNQIDWTAVLKDDALLQGKVRVGTTPAANTTINVYVWGSHTSLGSAALDVLDGTDSAETITSTGVLVGMTSDRDYFMAPVSVAALFGGVMPQFWGIFVAHNTASNLNSTGGNHAFSYTAVNWS